MAKSQLQQDWETRISEYRASGQSAKAWCAAHGVTTRQLWYWLRKFKTNQDVPAVKSARWLPLDLDVSGQAPVVQNEGLLVRVGQASIEVKPGFDPALLSEIVRILVAVC
ncbi:MAG: helix-turn-helix domain-containing protein [Peptococcaceae bacterium]|nr:helix-turn-helix domain-containing protein [Peptococcaceae bacterium]